MTDDQGTGGGPQQWPVDPSAHDASYGQQPAPPYGRQPGAGPSNQPFGQPPSSPYGQQPGYGQPGPSYGQQPSYGQPGPSYGQQPSYGQPGQPYDPAGGYGQPGGFQPYVPGYPNPSVPPQKSWIQRFWPILAGIAGLIVVLIVIGAIAGGGNANPGSSHTLSAPAQSGSYSKQSGALADQVTDSMTTALDGKFSQSELRTGVYGSAGGSTPEFIFLGVQSSKLSDQSPDSTIDSFMTGAKVSSPGSVDAGPLGGKMRCGVSSNSQTTCVWVDHNTLGALVFGTLDGTAAADVTRTFRGDAEK